MIKTLHKFLTNLLTPPRTNQKSWPNQSVTNAQGDVFQPGGTAMALVESFAYCSCGKHAKKPQPAYLQIKITSSYALAPDSFILVEGKDAQGNKRDFRVDFLLAVNDPRLKSIATVEPHDNIRPDIQGKHWQLIPKAA